jgi:hypothetical protein
MDSFYQVQATPSFVRGCVQSSQNVIASEAARLQVQAMPLICQGMIDYAVIAIAQVLKLELGQLYVYEHDCYTGAVQQLGFLPVVYFPYVMHSSPILKHFIQQLKLIYECLLFVYVLDGIDSD